MGGRRGDGEGGGGREREEGRMDIDSRVVLALPGYQRAHKMSTSGNLFV